MAIRNDFAPGEVLAAADLNDTFGSKLDYPSGGADGNVLTKSGTAAAWSAPEAGLTLIASESFSAVSSVSLNGCFSATYNRYRVIISGVGSATTAAELRIRYRASSTDNTAAEYDFAGQQNSNSGGAHVFGLLATSGLIGHQANNSFAQSLDLVDPFLASQTSHLSLSTAWGDTTAVCMYMNGKHRPTTSYDGFTLFPASGTITGNLRVYGYQN
jgi:hypothetical protein